MDISSLQFSTSYTEQIISQTETQKNKDFEAVLDKAVKNKDDEALKAACVELENYMLSQIMKQMKSAFVSEDSLIPKGDYEKMFEDYNINNQAESMTKAGGIGLADMLYKQMKNTYGAQVNSNVQNSPRLETEA